MDFASIIRQGEKDYNSDFLRIIQDDTTCCFCVADGRETSLAAELSVNTICDDFETSHMITKSSVSDFFAHANEVVSQNEYPLSASCACLLTDESVAVWGSIGDCRVYLLRENWLYEITPDHSDAYSLYEAGEIRYPKIRRNKTRYNLHRMIGKDKNNTPFSSQPEVLKVGDSLLICTDGFWANIHERQIEKTLKRSKSAQEWLDKMMHIIDKNIHYKKYSRFRDSLCAITIKI